MKKAIKIIEKMQKNSVEEVQAMKGKKMNPGYEDYAAGWDDALEEVKKELESL